VLNAIDGKRKALVVADVVVNVRRDAHPESAVHAFDGSFYFIAVVKGVLGGNKQQYKV